MVVAARGIAVWPAFRRTGPGDLENAPAEISSLRHENFASQRLEPFEGAVDVRARSGLVVMPPVLFGGPMPTRIGDGPRWDGVALLGMCQSGRQPGMPAAI